MAQSSSGKGGDDQRSGARGGSGRIGRIELFQTRLQAMRKGLGARHYAVFRIAGVGVPPVRTLALELNSWGEDAEHEARALVSLFGDDLVSHIESSLLPVVWNGAGDHQVCDVDGLSRFFRRLRNRSLPWAGLAFPVRLGSQGNGYVVFAAESLDLTSETILSLHARACQIMTDMLSMEERKAQPAAALNEREIACLQMAGDGHTSEAIAEKMGLSVHTVNAYLGTATTKLNSVNRIQAIAKAIRLGFID
ncbi:transcriptional regulator VisR [Rhizobium sp. SG2393]|uniref:transcriptional regulator VisR n=1 Tax=Rhizobium sp. SG2393 TaxID=3276279 RepID=UPI003671C615